MLVHPSSPIDEGTGKVLVCQMLTGSIQGLLKGDTLSQEVIHCVYLPVCTWVEHKYKLNGIGQSDCIDTITDWPITGMDSQDKATVFAEREPQ